jgi:hypothetical protein
MTRPTNNTLITERTISRIISVLGSEEGKESGNEEGEALGSEECKALGSEEGKASRSEDGEAFED